MSFEESIEKAVTLDQKWNDLNDKFDTVRNFHKKLECKKNSNYDNFYLFLIAIITSVLRLTKDNIKISDEMYELASINLEQMIRYHKILELNPGYAEKELNKPVKFDDTLGLEGYLNKKVRSKEIKE